MPNPAERRTAEALGPASCLVYISWPYTQVMDPAKMNELLAMMKPEEIRDGLRLA